MVLFYHCSRRRVAGTWGRHRDPEEPQQRGRGAITIPGLVKIEKKKVPARKAEKGVPNPFKTGELMDRPAKPAYNKVKVRALKLLKDMAK